MRNLLLAATVFTVTGCASIISDTNYPVSVTSTPAGANYEIRNEKGHTVLKGVTPDQVTLEAGAGYFNGETYQVAYSKEGYQNQHSIIDSSIDGWYWANIIFGGLIGMLIVDPATGAMYKLPENTNASLTPLAAPAVDDSSQE